MFLPIRAICDRRPRRDGTCVISIQYCCSSDKRTILFTGLSIPNTAYRCDIQYRWQTDFFLYGGGDKLDR